MLVFTVKRLKRLQTRHYNTEAVCFSRVCPVLLSLFCAVADVNRHIRCGTSSACTWISSSHLCLYSSTCIRSRKACQTLPTPPPLLRLPHVKQLATAFRVPSMQDVIPPKQPDRQPATALMAPCMQLAMLAQMLLRHENTAPIATG